MKKLMIISTLVTILYTSCGVSKIAYNEAIVKAHTSLLDVNHNFANQFDNFVGKADQKDALIKLVDESLTKMKEARKPIDELKPIEDEGMRAKLLEMFDVYASTLENYKSKADFVTNEANYNNVVDMYNEELEKIQKLDAEIQDMQVKFASKNNIQMR